MTPPTDNPFSALTLIAAPALLTNSSAVLLLSTSNRFARAIDRGRALARQLRDEAPDGPAGALLMHQLALAERRVRLVVRALTAFYIAAGAFAAGTLIALLGATVAALDMRGWLPAALGATLVIGTLGFAGLVLGAITLAWETRIAAAMLRDEARQVVGRLTGVAAPGRPPQPPDARSPAG